MLENDLSKNKRFPASNSSNISSEVSNINKHELANPLEPRSLPNPLPIRCDMTKKCDFHRTPEHSTNRCAARCHANQDLIDKEIIVSPPSNRPNKSQEQKTFVSSEFNAHR
nr:hypothetical protein CFP56_31984 [Quercus suber]